MSLRHTHSQPHHWAQPPTTAFLLTVTSIRCQAPPLVETLDSPQHPQSFRQAFIRTMVPHCHTRRLGQTKRAPWRSSGRNPVRSHSQPVRSIWLLIFLTAQSEFTHRGFTALQTTLSCRLGLRELLSRVLGLICLEPGTSPRLIVLPCI